MENPRKRRIYQMEISILRAIQSKISGHEQEEADTKITERLVVVLQRFADRFDMTVTLYTLYAI